MASLMKKLLRFRPVYIALAAVFIGVVAYTNGIAFLDLVELKTIDLRFQTRGEIQPKSEVVLAVVDEKSIAREGKWVWPRSKFVQLLERLSAAGAKVVAFDIGFLEPDNRQLIQTVHQIEAKIRQYGGHHTDIENFLNQVRMESDNDLRLADAIRKSSAKVVLGYFFHTDTESAGHFTKEDLDKNAENLKGAEYKLIRYTSRAAKNVPLFQAFAPEANITVISEATPYAGSFSMKPDPDGVVRRMPAVFKFRDYLYPPLSLMAVRAYLDTDIALDISEFGIDSLRLGRLLIPADEYGNVFINYRGGPKTFPHLSVTDILQGKIPDAALKNKIVLVGVTATGVYDLRVTPFASVYPGVEIHANVIDTVLSENFLNQPEWGKFFDVLAMIVAGIFLGIVLARAGVALGAVTAGALFLAYILVCYYFFKDWKPIGVAIGMGRRRLLPKPCPSSPMTVPVKPCWPGAGNLRSPRRLRTGTAHIP